MASPLFLINWDILLFRPVKTKNDKANSGDQLSFPGNLSLAFYLSAFTFFPPLLHHHLFRKADKQFPYLSRVAQVKLRSRNIPPYLNGQCRIR